MESKKLYKAKNSYYALCEELKKSEANYTKVRFSKSETKQPDIETNSKLQKKIEKLIYAKQEAQITYLNQIVSFF